MNDPEKSELPNSSVEIDEQCRWFGCGVGGAKWKCHTPQVAGSVGGLGSLASCSMGWGRFPYRNPGAFTLPITGGLRDAVNLTFQFGYECLDEAHDYAVLLGFSARRIVRGVPMAGRGGLARRISSR